MAKRAINTSIDNEVQDKFRAMCEENNLKMNLVLEQLMIAYIEGKISFKLEMEISK